MHLVSDAQSGFPSSVESGLVFEFGFLSAGVITGTILDFGGKGGNWTELL